MKFSLKEFFVREGIEDYQPAGVSSGLPTDEPMKGNTGWSVVIDGEIKGAFEDYDTAHRMAQKLGGEVVPAEDSEIASGDMDDFGFIGGDEEWTEDGGEPETGIEPSKGSQPHEFDWTQGTPFNDDEPRRTKMESIFKEGGWRPVGSARVPASPGDEEFDQPVYDALEDTLSQQGTSGQQLSVKMNTIWNSPNFKKHLERNQGTDPYELVRSFLDGGADADIGRTKMEEGDFDNNSPEMQKYYRSLRGAEYDPEYMKVNHRKGDPFAYKPVPPAGSGNPDPSSGKYSHGDFTTDEPKRSNFVSKLFGSKGAKMEHQDPTVRKDVGSTAWSSPSQEVDIKHFFNRDGTLDIDLDEMGGPGSGRKKGSKNKPKGLPSVTPGKQVDPSTLPDELPDEWIADEPQASAPEQELGPFSRADGDEDEFSFLDDPNYGKGVEMPVYEPRPKKAKGQSSDDDDEAEIAASREKERASQFPDESNFDWTFDDLRFEEPDVADDIETELGSEAMQGAKFTRSRGFFYMITGDGERWKGSAAAGWLPFDDGKSPVGEF